MDYKQILAENKGKNNKLKVNTWAQQSYSQILKKKKKKIRPTDSLTLVNTFFQRTDYIKKK